MEMLNTNSSYAERCGIYRAVDARLIVAKAGSGKNDYVQFDLKKVKKNGRVDMLGFSHYFNIGIKELVEEYKRLGVTDKGISKENLAKAKEMYDKEETEAQFEFYGFFWNQSLGGVYKHKESGKISSETLVFIPCDEDTGIPKPEFAMTQARLNDILQNYTKVEGTTTEDTGENASNMSKEEKERAEYEAFLAAKRAAEKG
jgi:hypothetical protein